jgi:hypothetical protein
MEQKQKVIEAIFSIRPNGEFMIGGKYDYDALKWIDKIQKKPTEKEFNDAVTSWTEEYNSQEYARNRSTEYPALAEQLDEIYHNGIDSWKAVIKVTKDKYPKG